MWITDSPFFRVIPARPIHPLDNHFSRLMKTTYNTDISKQPNNTRCRFWSENSLKSMTQPTPRARNITTILHRVDMVSEKRLMESSIGRARAKIKMMAPAMMIATLGVTISTAPIFSCEKRSKSWVQEVIPPPLSLIRDPQTNGIYPVGKAINHSCTKNNSLFVVLITEGQKFSGISHKCRAVLPFSWRYLYDYSQNLQWPSIYVQGCEYG